MQLLFLSKGHIISNPRFIADNPALTHLVDEWHPTKNGEFTPYNTTIGSGKTISWVCSSSPLHEWEAMPGQRTIQSQGCPYCSGQRVLRGYNDFATKQVELVKEWHPTLNAKISPYEVPEFTNKKAFWLCPVGEDHVWEASINSRSKGNKCPYCTNRKILTGFNDLASKIEFSKVVSEWHPALNGDITPDQVAPASSKYAWWLCGECQHEWKAIIANRTIRGSKCPKCSKSNPVKKLKTITESNLIQEWHPDNELDPNDVTLGSSKQALWQCLKDNRHTWTAIISNRGRGLSNCTICSNYQIVAGINDLASDARYQELVKEWHPDNELTPEDVGIGTDLIVKWQCHKEHVWDALIYSRTTKSQGCPECAGRRTQSGKRLVVADFPELMKQWHSSNILYPDVVTFQSAKKVTWICPKSDKHIWVASVASRTPEGTDCPICAGRLIIRGVNDVTSYAEYAHLVKEWHPDNIIMPYELSYSSNTMIKWQCQEKEDHVWSALLSSRVHFSSPSGCPRCALAKSTSKGEDEIYAVLELLGVNDVKTSVTNLIPSREIDIYVPENKLAIEFNGIYWHSDKIRPDPLYHTKKREACIKRGIEPYNIWEDDWRQNRDVIIRDIALKLNLSAMLPNVIPNTPAYWYEEVDSSTLKVQIIKEDSAQRFMSVHHLRGFVTGNLYVGLIDSQERVRSVMILTVDTLGQAIILRYATAGVINNGFSTLMDFITTNNNIQKITIIADLAIDSGELYQQNGFVQDFAFEPDYSYMIKGKRVDQSQVRINTFKNNPNYKFQDGMSVRELADLNQFNKVWDFGKIRYVKTTTQKEA